MSAPLPDPSLPWPIPLEAVRLIAESEGLRLKAYLCPAGVPTIGWGETDNVRLGDTCTKEQADRWLVEDITDRVKAVQEMLTAPANDNQLGAMVSLAYNIGLRDDKNKRGLFYTTVRRLHNLGDFEGASRAFSLLNKARNRKTGQLEEFPGLVLRRNRESALYLVPDEGEPPLPTPQAVEPESKVAASPIAQGGATTAGVGILAAIAEAKEALGPVGSAFTAARDFLANAVGVPPSWVLPGVLIGAGIVVVRWRIRQRKDGWC